MIRKIFQEVLDLVVTKYDELIEDIRLKVGAALLHNGEKPTDPEVCAELEKCGGVMVADFDGVGTGIVLHLWEANSGVVLTPAQAIEVAEQLVEAASDTEPAPESPAPRPN